VVFLDVGTDILEGFRDHFLETCYEGDSFERRLLYRPYIPRSVHRLSWLRLFMVFLSTWVVILRKWID